MHQHIRKLKNTAHFALAVSANTLHFFPSKGLTIIGVTGTDGKTTTSNLIYHILREAGIKTAVISTLGAVINGKTYETGFHVTTPSPFAIQKYIKLAKQEGCTHVVLEVTSHALDQHRVWGINFDIGVLTNITPEHLDYHRNYDNYVDTKLKLFKNSKLSVINSNGIWFEKAISIIPKDRLVSYSLHGVNKNDLSLINIPFQIKTKLIGDFNLENILAAVCTTLALGINQKTIESAITSFEPPAGRQEEFVSKNNARIMVDFAHTANSFDVILPEVRKTTKGKVIHVFGAAGDRDRGKRPEMGKVASYYDDIIVLTAEDPRSETVQDMNAQIKSGISDLSKVHEIENRNEAISHAISLATADDTVIITGKGHELTMNLGHGEIKWSDRDAVKKLIGM